MVKANEKKAKLYATELKAKAKPRVKLDLSPEELKLKARLKKANNSVEPVEKPYEPSLNIPVAGQWSKANLIAFVNGSPAMTAVSVSNLVLYKGGILEYQLPVRDSKDMTVLFTDLRLWLVQPCK